MPPVARYFSQGQLARVITGVSEYFGLTGRLVEVTRFNDAGVLEFPETELQRAARPERVLKGKPRVHFYFRELQGVDQYEL